MKRVSEFYAQETKSLELRKNDATLPYKGGGKFDSSVGSISNGECAFNREKEMIYLLLALEMLGGLLPD